MHDEAISAKGKAGYLYKLGSGGFHSWKKRYFDLQNGRLRYCKTMPVAEDKSKLQGSVSVEGATVTIHPQGEYGKRSGWIFGVKPPIGSRVYFLEAVSESERTEWVAALIAQGAVRFTGDSVHHVPVLKEGYLVKISQDNKRKYRRYFLLKGATLAYFKNQEMKKILAEILIGKDTTLGKPKVTDYKKGVFPFAITESRGARSYILEAASEADRDAWLAVLSKVVQGEGGGTASESAWATRHKIGVVEGGAPASPTSPVFSPSSRRGMSQHYDQRTLEAMDAVEHAPVVMSDNEDDMPLQDEGEFQNDTDSPGDEGRPDEDEDMELEKEREREIPDQDVRPEAIREAVRARFKYLLDDICDGDLQMFNAHMQAYLSAAGLAKRFNAGSNVLAVPNSPVGEDEDDEDDDDRPSPAPSPRRSGGSRLSVAANSVLSAYRGRTASQADQDRDPDRESRPRNASQTKHDTSPQPPNKRDPSPQPPPLRRYTSTPLPFELEDLSQIDKPDPRVLHIHLLEGRSLPGSDIFGEKRGMYCQFTVRGKATEWGKEEAKSDKCKSAANLVWDQKLSMISRDLNQEELVVDVFERFGKQKSDAFLGWTSIPLSDLKDPREDTDAAGRARAITTTTKPYRMLQGWFPILDKREGGEACGHICLRLISNEDPVIPKEEWKSTKFHRQREQLFGLMPQLRPRQRTLSVCCASWNVGNAAPPDDLTPWLPIAADVYAIGTQECKYNPRGDTKSAREDWSNLLLRHFGVEYVRVKFLNLGEMRLAVFVRKKLFPYVSSIRVLEVATGVGNVLGNKGAMAVGFEIMHTPMCFVTCHLAAHQDQSYARNEDYARIVRAMNVGSMDLLSTYPYICWMGDLNYRIDFGDTGYERVPTKEHFNEFVAMIDKKEFAPLYAIDQLRVEMEARRVFVGFEEAPIFFKPTFKLCRSTPLQYDSHRSPAWCDRILHRSLQGGVKIHEYTSTEAIYTSDHKPVSCALELVASQLFPPIDYSRGRCILSFTTLDVKGIRLLGGQQKKQTGLSTMVKKMSEQKEVATGQVIDPYVRISGDLLSEPFMTPPQRKTLNPSWIAQGPIQLLVNRHSRLEQSVLQIQVAHKIHLSAAEVVGRATLGLKLPSGVADRITFEFQLDLTLHGLPTGLIKGVVSLEWEPRPLEDY